MSFACDACNKPIPVGNRSDWIDRCPWCGGPVTYLGLTAVSPAPAGRKPATNRRSSSTVRASHTMPSNRIPEWVAWAGAIVFLLFVLLGTSLYLASTIPAKPVTGSELAVVNANTSTEPEQRLPALDEPRPTEPGLADAGTLPDLDERPAQKQPEAKSPIIEKPNAQEPAPSEQQKLSQQQAPLDQLPRPQEQKPSDSLLNLSTGQQTAQQQSGQPQGGQQPGVQPGGVRPIPQDGMAKGKQPEAIFMGVRALGSRICIIADCSGSMAYNNRMNRLKVELKKTVERLTPEQEFFIIYFSDSATPMRTKKTWWRGGEDLKRVFNWIDSQPPGGGTEPMPAFERAFRLKPRPDAIFFLTDGLIPLTTPQGVARLNGKNKVPIHTILFGGELAGVEERVVMVPVNVRGKITMVPRRVPIAKMEKDMGQLQQVSRDSGGTHRFVPDDGKVGR
jgi:hypothetical protein